MNKKTLESILEFMEAQKELDENRHVMIDSLHTRIVILEKKLDIVTEKVLPEGCCIKLDAEHLIQE